MTHKPDFTALSDTMQRFYRTVSRKYALSTHHLRLLQCGCEAYTRMQEAQRIIAEQGLTTVDRHGQARPHPAVQIELQSRTAFMRSLRELGLEDDEQPDTRPPRLHGRYTGRA